ncbi:hypothetical protein X777_02122 [Ooceraea biroi]|uniref:Uncharacterized protein n=1 Tax=Ooceraea biroi TaxID=2015173 RepID=A0A026WND8_OOCBI|nr:hypothetical protein X777_02122 [Ooceraea biroi]
MSPFRGCEETQDEHEDKDEDEDEDEHENENDEGCAGEVSIHKLPAIPGHNARTS